MLESEGAVLLVEMQRILEYSKGLNRECSFFVFHTAIMLFSSMIGIDHASIQIHLQ